MPKKCVCDAICYTVNCPCDVACYNQATCNTCNYTCYAFLKVCSICDGTCYLYDACDCDTSAYYTTCNCDAMKYAPGVWLFY